MLQHGQGDCEEAGACHNRGPMHATQTVTLIAAAFGGGLMNAMAGGGTILVFPALLFIGEPAITANATSTVALLPGAAASLAGYRREVVTHLDWLKTLLLPSLLGGALGSVLLLRTPEESFARLAPVLVLFATVLFMVQGLVARRAGRRDQAAGRRGRQEEEGRPGGGAAAPTGDEGRLPAAVGQPAERAGSSAGASGMIGASSARGLPVTADGQRSRGSQQDARENGDEHLPRGRWLAASLFQFAVAVYGGYFGAGIGILTLAVLGFLGLSNIFAMNGLKNFFGFCINGVAAAYFIFCGRVVWPIALVLMVGSITGGYGGALLARRIGKEKARASVVVIGLLVTVILFWQNASR